MPTLMLSGALLASPAAPAVSPPVVGAQALTASPVASAAAIRNFFVAFTPMPFVEESAEEKTGTV